MRWLLTTALIVALTYASIVMLSSIDGCYSPKPEGAHYSEKEVIEIVQEYAGTDCLSEGIVHPASFSADYQGGESGL